MKNITEEVAKAHGISEQEVRNEMRVAIREAMKSTDPTAQAFWKQILRLMPLLPGERR